MPIAFCPVGTSSAGNAYVLEAVQEVVGLLCWKCTLLAYVQLGGQWDAQVLLCKTAVQPVSPQPRLVCGVIVPQVQDYRPGIH